MTTSNGPSMPDDDGVKYEYINDLDVLLYVDGGNAISGTAIDPAARRIIERDRQQIAELIAWTRHEQEKLNARKHQQPPDESRCAPE